MRRPDPLSEDTIAAIATPQGRGAVALVRISGPGAPDILRAICPSLSSSAQIPPRYPRLLTVVHPESGEQIDRALVTFFPRPGTFTGEDCVEISTHGGLLTPHLVLAAALAGGARGALPGEFTRRALQNGKLDLTQAEAILDLVNSTSPALHRVAIHQLERGLSGRIGALRAGIVRAEALIGYSIDFPDEDEPPVPPEKIAGAVEATLRQVESMLRTAPQGEMLREGALVVLAGQPNAGKSSLFNALLGFERSIVTDLPGTTRDAVEATMTIEGFPFRLVDTAGLRSTTDRVEGMGVEVAHRYLADAELVLYCAEAGGPLDDGALAFLKGRPDGKTVLVRTKADLVVARIPQGEQAGAVQVSTVTGEGLGELAERVVQASFGLIRHGEREAPLVTRERHSRALRAAAAELRSFLDAFEQDVPMELAATHLGAAVGALEEIIGIVATDDILGAIFGEFCVGK